MHNTSNERRHTATLSKYMQLGLHTMTPAIIAHYLVAIAVIAAALAVAALAAGAAASSVDLTAGAYAVSVVKLAAGCALSALFASLSGALFDAAED